MGTLEDKGKFISVGCLWTVGEAHGADIGKLDRKGPSEMDLGAALLVLAGTDVEPGRPCPASSLSASRIFVRSGCSPAVHRQVWTRTSHCPRTEGSWTSVETSTVQQVQGLTIDLHNPHQESMKEAALAALIHGR